MIEKDLLKISSKMNKTITISKSSGTTLLNKDYVKDFIAMLIAVINTHSTFYWKHVFNLHHIVTEDYSMEGLAQYNMTPTALSLSLYKILTCNNINIKKINKVKDYMKVLWKEMKVANITERNNDIECVIQYIESTLENSVDISLEEFISSLYLDKIIEKENTDSLFLSSIHSCKGLEWERVYIIDMMSCIFKSNSFSYQGEIEYIEEERRLFYVACSRAKKHLIITSDDMSISPFINELDSSLYDVSPTTILLLSAPVKKTGDINKDITSYISRYGYNEIIPILLKVDPITMIIETMDKDDMIKQIVKMYNGSSDITVFKELYNIISIDKNSKIIENYNSVYHNIKISCDLIISDVIIEFISNIDVKTLVRILLVAIIFNKNNSSNHIKKIVLIDTCTCTGTNTSNITYFNIDSSYDKLLSILYTLI